MLKCKREVRETSLFVLKSGEMMKNEILKKVQEPAPRR